MGKLLDELKRRKVFKVSAVYAVVAWLLIQVADTVLPALQMPDWTVAFVTILFILGFPIAVILAWAYEVTPEGIRADNPNQIASTGAVTPASDRKLIYATFALVLLVAGFQIADRFLAPVQQSALDQSMAETNEAVTETLASALPETRLDLVTPVTEHPTDFALSPDGRRIVFVASDPLGTSQLWLRSLATTAVQPLAGTEGAQQPFWSPDGRAIGFFAGSSLKRLTLGSSTPQVLATMNAPRGGTWGADNTILYTPSSADPLMRVLATGSAAEAVTTLGPLQRSHRHPRFLPDGRRFLFFVLGTPETGGIYLGSLDGSAPVKLTDADSEGVYHPDGWLLWARAGVLTAQRLDIERATLTGELLTVADEVSRNSSIYLSALSVAGTGLIAYRSGEGQPKQLTWFDRTGAILGTLGEPDDTIRFPSLSSDGHRIAVTRTVQGNQEIWLLDGVRSSRFTFNTSSDSLPLWSSDDSQIVFRSNRTGVGDLYQKPSNGAGEETLLFSSDQLKTPNSWSADGRFLLYHSNSPETARDLWALPVTGEPVPFIVLQTPFNESFGTFSPDGRWVAYHSDELGRSEVYVRSFVAPMNTDEMTVTELNGLWQVSTAGGVYPTWGTNGRELYYLDPAGNLMAASFAASADNIAVGKPTVLFPTRIFGGGVDGGLGRQYDVAADGRFLINSLVGEGSTAPITLIQNWNPEAVQ